MLENKSVKEIISLIKTKEASIKEVVIFYLERIKKYNPSLNAIVSPGNLGQLNLILII